MVVAIASCSFPAFDITVSGGSSGATTAATGSSGSAGGSGGASTSSGSAGGAGGAIATASSSASTSSGSTTSTGPCSTDADGDKYISAKCPGGNDCADGDALANINGDYHTFPITNPPPGTLPFDFNCSGGEEAETPKVSCGVDCASQGFNAVVPCGSTAPLGKCGGVVGFCTFQPLSPAASKTQRCK